MDICALYRHRPLPAGYRLDISISRSVNYFRYTAWQNPMNARTYLRTLGFITIVVFAVLASPRTTVSQDSRSTNESQIKCHLLYLRSDFFDQFDYWLSHPAKDAYRLNEIESFFLFNRKNLRNNPWTIRPLTKTTIRDRTVENSKQKSIDLIWKPIQESKDIEILIDNSTGSKFKLRKPIKVKIPPGGSVVVRSSNPPEKGKSTFYWITLKSNKPK